jgi:hypothetical protein
VKWVQYRAAFHGSAVAAVLKLINVAADPHACIAHCRAASTTSIYVPMIIQGTGKTAAFVIN